MVCLNRGELKGKKLETSKNKDSRRCGHTREPIYFCLCLYPWESWGSPWGGPVQTRPGSLHLCIGLAGMPVCWGQSQFRGLGKVAGTHSSPSSEVSLWGWRITQLPSLWSPPLHLVAGLTSVRIATLLTVSSPAVSARDPRKGLQVWGLCCPGVRPLAPPHCPACAGRGFPIGPFPRSQAAPKG